MTSNAQMSETRWQYSHYSVISIAICLQLLTKVISVSRDFPIGCNEVISILRRSKRSMEDSIYGDLRRDETH